MTPKEKAKELYSKMKFETEFNSQPSTVHGVCKNLALVFIKEVLTEINKLPSKDLSDIQFWTETEFHINEM